MGYRKCAPYVIRISKTLTKRHTTVTKPSRGRNPGENSFFSSGTLLVGLGEVNTYHVAVPLQADLKDIWSDLDAGASVSPDQLLAALAFVHVVAVQNIFRTKSLQSSLEAVAIVGHLPHHDGNITPNGFEPRPPEH